MELASRHFRAMFAAGAMCLALAPPADAIDLGLGPVSTSVDTSGASLGVTQGNTSGTTGVSVGTNGVTADLGGSQNNTSGNGTIGVDLGTRSVGVNVGVNQPGTSVTPSIATPSISGSRQRTSSTLASLSNTQIAAYKLRCRGILANPSAFDKDLVSLCHLIRSSKR